jgi:4-diphosphocytidyl-2C-methyl-D-erythritol kinase
MAKTGGKMDICEHAHAKINLILDVAGKRPDGYHELNTVFQSLMLHDTLKFSVNDGGGLSCRAVTLLCPPALKTWPGGLQHC